MIASSRRSSVEILVLCGAAAVAAVNVMLGKAVVKRTTGVRLRVPRLDNGVELESLTPTGLLNMMNERLASATGDIRRLWRRRKSKLTRIQKVDALQIVVNK